MADRSTDGHRGGRTPGAAAPAGADGGADLAAIEADDAALIDGSPDLLGLDVLGAAAELVARERRARGRPLGAANRRNGELFRYLEALGHRHPAVTLSAIQTADTVQLARALSSPLLNVEGHPVRDADGSVVYVGCDPLDVLKVQAKAAADLLPFDLAKKTQLELPTDPNRRPLLAIGELNIGQLNQFGDVMSAGEWPPTDAQRNQGVIDVDAVRDGDASSHDAG